MVIWIYVTYWNGGYFSYRAEELLPCFIYLNLPLPWFEAGLDFFSVFEKERFWVSYDNIYKDNSDGTITQIDADILWSKRDSRQELGKWLNWDEANAYAKACNEQKYLGYDDWRLPTKSELRKLFKNNDAYRELFLNEPRKVKQVVSNYKGGGELSLWTCETRFDSFAWKCYFPSTKELCVDPQVSTTGTSVRLVRDL